LARISPKAVVVNPDGLADDVEVGPFSYVAGEVEVGPGTRIANGVTVTGRTRVGAGCWLHAGCIVGCAPPGRSEDDAGPCTVADGNVIREHVIIEAGADPDGEGTRLAERNMLMVGCQVAHDASVAEECIFANFTRLERGARVERFVRTSGFTLIQAYATVGAYSFTTGYASVVTDVPPYAIVQGLPSRVRCVNTENLRRCGFDAEAIRRIKGAFRMLFDGAEGPPDDERLRAVERAFDDEHVRHLLDSLRRSAASGTGRQRQPAAGEGR